MTPGKVTFEGARTDWALKCTVITPQFVSLIHRLRLCGLKAWGLRKTPELVNGLREEQSGFVFRYKKTQYRVCPASHFVRFHEASILTE